MQIVKLGILNLVKMEDDAARLLECGKLRRSERLLKRILAHDPHCLAAHFHLARVYRRTEQYDLALFHARRTLRLNRRERNAHLNLGLIYDCIGRDNLAVLHYRRELLRNPGSAETLWNIGRLYFRKRRWLQASKYLRRCFETGFQFELEDTVDKLGICYNRLRDVKSYIAVFASYVHMVPSATWAYSNLGRALLYAKDYKGAVLRLSRAKQLGAGKSIADELVCAKEMLRQSRRSLNSGHQRRGTNGGLRRFRSRNGGE